MMGLPSTACPKPRQRICRKAMSHTAGIPMSHLKPLPNEDWNCSSITIQLIPEEFPLTIGRSAQFGIPAQESAISRTHAQLIEADESGYLIKPAKKIWVRSYNGRTVQAVAPGESTWLKTGDCLFLACKKGKPMYGYRITRNGKSARARRKSELPSPGLESPTKAMRLSPDHPKSSLIFRGLYLVFWEHHHMRRAKELCKLAGAELQDVLTPTTTHVISSKFMSIAEAAKKLNQKADSLEWPPNVSFVDPSFVTQSLAQQKLMDSAKHTIICRQSASASPRSEASQEPHSLEAALRSVSCDSKEAPKLKNPGGKRQSRESLAVSALPTKSAPRGQGNVTGGDSGIPWGSQGCWIEPWTEKSALETVDKLDRWWHRRDADDCHEERAGRVSAPGSDSDEAEQSSSAIATSCCSHPSCAACRICIVEELKVLIGQYDRVGIDQFRRRAAENGIRKILKHGRPLRKLKDVESLELGKETTAKVAELVETGQLARNKASQADPTAQLILKFARVWGTGHATALKWHSEGCRTLDDVRKRGDLTEQQVAGLRHFKDMEIKIPRDEGLIIAQRVTEAALSLFEWDLGSEDAPHIRPMGSFLRGKKGMSDIDMLILPPAYEARTPSELLSDLWHHLRNQDFVTTDVRPHGAKTGDDSCTFLGFCRLPGHPHVRRLDIKIYPRWSLPFAINYFTGSGSFNRALRFWATTAPLAQEAAKQLAPGSTGFKLNDTCLVPISREGYGKDRREVLLGGIVKEINCETDLFSVLSLSYVPPHLRMTND